MGETHYLLEFRPYCRPFLQPLRTHHGLWEQRQGVLLRLSAGDRVSYGEIAPLPEFGSETLAAALAFCRGLGATVSEAQLKLIPAVLPACQFAFETAVWGLRNQGQPPNLIPALPPAHACALLPSGEAALQRWQDSWAAGHRNFKWKIGVHTPTQELTWGKELRSQLPPSAKLRLDANGGLSLAATHTWLTWCDQVEIEFLEQPLPTTDSDPLHQLSQQYRTPIALDESVSSLADLQQWRQRGWAGVFVVKPAIAGSPAALVDWYQHHQPRLVLSTVFETPVGRQAIRQLAAVLYSDQPPLALGWGSPGFQDDWDQLRPDQVWQRLGPEGTWG